ncbi:MAG: hypothetical protein Q9160_004265 [Pyrenula sp. 1 TL-2023]
MSGLVGYGSSSEDETETSSHLKTSAKADSPRLKDEPSKDPTHSIDLSSKQEDSPKTFLGPQPDTTDSATQQHSSEAVEYHVSPETEKEAIQRLTASHMSVNNIPPSPPGSPNPAANARFARFLELKGKGIHFNEDLANKASYLNPSLFSTMLRRAGLEDQTQYQTSLPTSLWNVSNLPDDVYYEHLGKQQQTIREKREETKRAHSAAGTRVLEFVPPNNSDHASSKSALQSNIAGSGVIGTMSKRRKL